MSALAPCPPLKIAGHEGELVLFADAEGNRVATFASIAAWLGYSSKRPLLKLARRYSADLADLRRVSSVETRGRPRPTQLVDEVGCYVLALVSQTKRGRALRRVLSTWLANSDPSLSSPRTAGELLAIAHRRLRATHRELKALAKTPRPDGALDKDGKPRLLLVGAEVEVMAEAVACAGEAAPVIEFAVGGPQRVAMAHRKPLRRDDA